MAKPTPIYLEISKRRTFACSLEFPGWCRAGKTEEAAMEALAAYVPRYAVVAKAAHARFPRSIGDELDVVERLTGNATTEFGAPGIIAQAHLRPIERAEAKRHAALVEAAWATFADVVRHAPAELRKGPRGGGRDRDKMHAHVLGAEAGYARLLGIKHREPAIDDTEAIAALHADLRAVLSKPSDGQPVRPKGWPVRYAAHRLAWHALDHAWEIEDRSEPAAT